ncbi:hypothetical protein RRG08_011748 [Elysia crispata]|uniref:Uncharacterized protein n=1 Tax=Elysia crispata TaxID=231223 RepID=A0AAE0XE90_9GAST|nr:hypothetical protein RRG08_011748 [Elysia crispata]
MKSSVQRVFLCLLVASLFTVCVSRPGWRPQGRFGKRLSPSLPESQARSDFGMSGPLDVPIELIYTKEELQSAGAKPHLCSISGLREYPKCSIQTSSLVHEENDFLRALYRRR